VEADPSVSGLTAAEVDARRADGRSNQVPDPTSRSTADIVRANVLTPFNLLLGILLVVILAVGEMKDSLFGIVLVLNTMIGIVQEVRSKRALDHLALLSAPRACVRRDGIEAEVPVHDLVLDDLIVLRPGDQVAVDAEVLAANGLEIDESLLTGEADPVAKTAGDQVLSGSFVAVGDAAVRATAVGADTHAYRLGAEAKAFSLVHSELRDGVNRLITWIGWAMIPAAALLIWAQVRADLSFHQAVQASVAGLVAMVPEGLVLLTSVAFAVSATRLARRRVLTQELAAIEGLARVDVICVDKTGTLTEGELVLGSVEVLDGRTDPGGTGDAGDAERSVDDLLAALARSDDHPNSSLRAIGVARDHDPGWTVTGTVPFSSARKWSAASFDGRGSWLLGAPDILLGQAPDAVQASARASELADQGRRVLLVASAPDGLADDQLPARLEPTALVVLDERLRPSAPDTVAYFGTQGVTVKVISGDNPRTVGAVARACGVPGAESPYDARQLPDDDPEGLGQIVDDHAVFGRVTPHQKRAMVHALQARGHVVAMTGDGVNDTLALKDADIGVAMGAGSAAARAVARFVLLDDDFAVFPEVVSEGRRVIANVERVANLFLTKTFYALVLALVIGFSGLPYPFIPRHFTLLSSLTIGVPAFFLALAPNARRAAPGFLVRVLHFAVPCGVIVATAVIAAYLVARDRGGLDLVEQRTTAVIVAFLVAWWVLVILARPLDSWRWVLVTLMAASLVGALALGSVRHYFDLVVPPRPVLVIALVIAAVAGGVIELAWRRGWLSGRPVPPEGA
jgi:cation-transporting P-type ATPase E